MTTYQCACAYDELRTARTRGHIPSVLPAVTQPGTSLDGLYFCEECYELRCNDCIAWELSSCYCPHCLFEVPSTSVQAQKGQCARSCFACPVCTHVLSIHGSDPPRDAALTSAEASQSVPPYFFSCAACRWDSKRAGLVAEKASTLSDAPGPEQTALDQVRAHLAPLFQRAPKPSAAPPKALADLALPPRYWQGKNVAPPPPESDVLPAPPVDATGAQARQAAREAQRAAFVAGCTSLDGIQGLTDEAQRYAMPLEQPYEASALRPQRVRLLAKLCKRCRECRHILVRPDLRTSSSKYKLRLLAKEFLPTLRVVRAVDGVAHVTLANPLMDAMRIELYAPDAALSATSLTLPGGSEAYDVEPAATPAADTDLFAAGVVVSQHTAVFGVRTTRPMASVRVAWTVSERTHTFWAMLPVS